MAKKHYLSFLILLGSCTQNTSIQEPLEEITIEYPSSSLIKKEIKAFYMRVNDDNKTVAACDLLVPAVGELVGGSQREERYDILKEKMDALGNTEELSWYLDTRRFGGCRHSGFGIGFDRLIMYVTGIGNIRDVQPYPRTSGSIKY